MTDAPSTDLYLFAGTPPDLESMLRSVTMIPGTTEFGYGTTRVSVTHAAGERPAPLNYLAQLPGTDLVAALDDLQACAPHLRNVSLVVAWHGTDLRAEACKVRPRVEHSAMATAPYEWHAGGIARGSAQVVSKLPNGDPAVGGAPSDRTVFEALREIRRRGLRATLYPFLLMDIAPGNAAGQPPYPWRGRIVPSANGTPSATAQVAAFFGAAAPLDVGWDAANLRTTYSGPSEWSWRRFIFTLARIAKEAGVDDFLIGTEFVGLTQAHDGAGFYPAVEEFRKLAGATRAMLGSGVKISYAADWTEFHSHREGGVVFNMDPLWAHPAIDYVGIDNYLPLSDWRDGGAHEDARAGWASPHDLDYLRANVEGGEYYDWSYWSPEDRAAQTRRPLWDGDTRYNEHFIYRQKDIRGWWANPHHDRPGYVRSETPTAWVPKSKPIVFTEIGCAAIDKGSNQPNVFVDPKSSENFVPYFSNGRADPYVQRAYLEAWLGYWQDGNPWSDAYGGPMIDLSRASVWTWDARPWPAFPERDDFWGDAGNWRRGHWISGRVSPGRAFDAGAIPQVAYCDGLDPVTRAGVTYEPWPVRHGGISASSQLDNAELAVSVARGGPLDALFVAGPPSQVVHLTIFRGNPEAGDDARSAFPARWSGRVRGAEYGDTELSLTCEGVETALQRPGLTRNYQVACPHALYGEGCRADRARATVARTVTGAGIDLYVDAPLGDDMPADTAAALDARGRSRSDAYKGGIVSWRAASGAHVARSIVTVFEGGRRIKLRGGAGGLAEGDRVEIAMGCPRTLTSCRDLHRNALNYGGQPFIPLENPLSNKNVF